MLSYGGIGLIIDTPELHEFLRENQALVDSLPTWPTGAQVSGRGQGASLHYGAHGYLTDSHLSVFPYPPPPRFKLNAYYHPTGATRWSTFYGLTTTANAASLWSASSQGTQPLVLTLADESSHTAVSTLMHLLQPRAVTCSGQPQLILLPLVDARYWWNHTALAGSEYGALFQGATQYDTPDSKYGDGTANLPGNDSTEWPGSISQFNASRGPYFTEYGVVNEGGQSINFGQCFEQRVYNVGQRCVKLLNTTDSRAVYLQGFDTAETTLQANIARCKTPIAGGLPTTIVPAVPAKVVVFFQGYFQGAVVSRMSRIFGAPFVLARNAQSYIASGTGELSNIVKMVYTTAFADLNAHAEDGTDLVTFTAGATILDSCSGAYNQTSCNELADIIATDFYKSAKHSYDITYQGVAPWVPNGYDDHAEWSIGHVNDNGSESAQTRVQSAPLNFGVEEMTQQFISSVGASTYPFYIYESVSGFKKTGAGTGFNYSAVHLLTDGSPSSDYMNIYDMMQIPNPHLYDYGWARFSQLSGQWDIVNSWFNP